MKFDEYTLKDLLTNKGYIRGPFGSSLRRNELKQTGIPVYEQQNAIYNNRDFRYFIDEKKYKELSRFTVKENDLLVSCSGTLGKVSIILKNDPIGIISQALLLLRPNTNKILPFYLKYFFISNLGFNSIISRSSGSVQVNLAKRNIIEAIKIPLPPLPEQKAIASILSSLDDKIELNNRMNKTLEQMARAIFKRWFVDFEFSLDFARDKPLFSSTSSQHCSLSGVEGSGYKSSGGKMIDSELGMIPEGWRIGTLADEFNITMGQSPPGSTYNEEGTGIPFFQGRADFDFRFPKTRMYCSEPKRFAKKLNTLVSVRAPVGDMNIASEDCCIGRGLAAVIHKDDYYSYTYYKLLSLMDQFKNYESNGTVFGSINKNQFEGMKVIIPKPSPIKEFDNIVNAIDDKIYNLTKQNQTLSSLRDSLLPKLMSGELRVPPEKVQEYALRQAQGPEEVDA